MRMLAKILRSREEETACQLKTDLTIQRWMWKVWETSFFPFVEALPLHEDGEVYFGSMICWLPRSPAILE
jgi:hypothetical protein